YPTMEMNGKEKRPTRLAMGRYDIKLRPGVKIESASLVLDEGEAVIRCLLDGKAETIRISIPIDRPVLLLTADAGMVECVEAMPSYSFAKVKAYFDDFGIPA
ncbi:hypothetical protein K0U00_50940, partial [Paenibacillus sepulcri]|nr:hypothetical protein [Paenibacillus sepulcri]